jgi:hypothetical protein
MVTKYFWDHWKVYSKLNHPINTRFECYDGNYFEEMAINGNDLRMIVDAYYTAPPAAGEPDNDDYTTVAFALFCARDGYTERPTFGYTAINMYQFSTKEHDKYNQYTTILHEVMHAMGFHNFVFDSLPDFSSGSKRIRAESEVVESKKFDLSPF